MQTNKRKGLSALATVGIVVLLLLALRPPDRSLLDHATRIARTQDWQLGGMEAFEEQVGYFWLSDHQIFHFTGDSLRGYQAVCLDTDTGREAPLPALTPTQSGILIDVSPDGKWVLWAEHPRSRSTPAVTAVNGSGTIRWPQPWNLGNQAWLPDGRRWITVTFVPTGRFFRPGREIFAPGLGIFSLNEPRFQQKLLSGLTSASHILGVTPQGRLIIITDGDNRFDVWHYSRSGHFTALDYDLSQTGMPPRPFSIRIPHMPEAQDGVVRLSPHGDRLLWLYTSYHRPILGRLSEYFPLTVINAQMTYTLWVSRLDGSELHRIGSLDAGVRDHFAPAVHWTPDGKDISFVYNEEMYTIPAG